LDPLIFALLIDIILGEPPRSIHPVVWMGNLINLLKGKLNKGKKRKLKGAILALLAISLFTLPTFFLLYDNIIYLILSSFLLKTTFAIRAMDKFVKPIAEKVKEKDFEGAKDLLTHVVRRDTKSLKEQQVISAAVETTAEGTVDGLISPLFYYLIFGLPGAMAYRVINTLDSMVGYKDEENRDIGYFSAKLDTLANYIPARLVALLTILSSFLLKLDWRNSLYVTLRDARKTESYNAGYPMASMAGALGVVLEKPNHYILGIKRRDLNYQDIYTALKIMKLNLLLFLLIFYIPLILIKGVW